MCTPDSAPGTCNHHFVWSGYIQKKWWTCVSGRSWVACDLSMCSWICFIIRPEKGFEFSPVCLQSYGPWISLDSFLIMLLPKSFIFILPVIFQVSTRKRKPSSLPWMSRFLLLYLSQYIETNFNHFSTFVFWKVLQYKMLKYSKWNSNDTITLFSQVVVWSLAPWISPSSQSVLL